MPEAFPNESHLRVLGVLVPFGELQLYLSKKCVVHKTLKQMLSQIVSV